MLLIGANIPAHHQRSPWPLPLGPGSAPHPDRELTRDWSKVGGGGAHCCLERQNREVMEPRESPCFWCCETLARRCSSSWNTGTRLRLTQELGWTHLTSCSHLGQLSLPLLEGLDGVVLQGVVLQDGAHVVHAAQSDG